MAVPFISVGQCKQIILIPLFTNDRCFRLHVLKNILFGWGQGKTLDHPQVIHDKSSYLYLIDKFVKHLRPCVIH